MCVCVCVICICRHGRRAALVLIVFFRVQDRDLKWIYRRTGQGLRVVLEQEVQAEFQFDLPFDVAGGGG